MRRRAAMANLLAMAGWFQGNHAPEPAQAAAQPDIVFLMVDDMDARMVDDLPGLRALLADRGLTFTSAYTAAPVCCPARASFLRGQYPHNTGVLANGPPQGGFTAFRNNGNEASTVATWLQEAGYRTGLIGKYLNDYEKAPRHVAPGWNEWFVYAGEGKYYTYSVSDKGKIRKYGDKKKRNKHYQTDVLARKAVAFINDTPSTQPLFLFLAPSAPHEPASPARRHKKASLPRASALRVPSFNEEDMSDKAGIWSRGLLPGSKIRDIDKVYVKQLKSMLAVQEMLQHVIDALQAQGRLSNTYIVFASDNGYHHGEHRIGLDKNSPFEESTRTPLMVVGPGIPSGVTSDAMVSLIDLAPTFADLAGATIPDFVDGRSLVPLLDGSTPPTWRDAIVSELLRGPNGGFRVLREGSHVYTAWGSGDRELYDLEVDPYQLDNIAASAPQSLLDGLQARIDAFAACGSEGPQTCQQVDGGS